MIGAWWLVLACSGPEGASEDLDALSRWLYAEQEEAGDGAMADGMGTLLACAAGLDPGATEELPAWTIAPLAREDVEALVAHDRDPAAAPGVGVPFRSAHGIDAHAAVMVLEDQTVVEPDAVRFERTLVEGSASCWLDRSCTRIRTVNEVERENLLYQAAYVIYKDLRWVPLDDGNWAVASRSWLPEPANEDGLVPILQAYDLDVYIGDGTETVRWHVTWQETDVPGVSDEGVAGVVAMGISDMYEAWESYLGEIDPLP